MNKFNKRNSRCSQRASRFICLECKEENCVGQGIQRFNQRPKYHIKNLYCIRCNKITQNVEVRYCDHYEEIYNELEEIKQSIKEKKVFI